MYQVVDVVPTVQEVTDLVRTSSTRKQHTFWYHHVSSRLQISRCDIYERRQDSYSQRDNRYKATTTKAVRRWAEYTFPTASYKARARHTQTTRNASVCGRSNTYAPFMKNVFLLTFDTDKELSAPSGNPFAAFSGSTLIELA